VFQIEGSYGCSVSRIFFGLSPLVIRQLYLLCGIPLQALDVLIVSLQEEMIVNSAPLFYCFKSLIFIAI
jgi:positive regulator of sigma E activity